MGGTEGRAPENHPQCVLTPFPKTFCSGVRPRKTDVQLGKTKLPFTRGAIVGNSDARVPRAHRGGAWWGGRSYCHWPPALGRNLVCGGGQQGPSTQQDGRLLPSPTRPAGGCVAGWDTPSPEMWANMQQAQRLPVSARGGQGFCSSSSPGPPTSRRRSCGGRQTAAAFRLQGGCRGCRAFGCEASAATQRPLLPTEPCLPGRSSFSMKESALPSL